VTDVRCGQIDIKHFDVATQIAGADLFFKPL